MFAGLTTLVKLIFRRDRVKLPVWIFCFTLFLLWMVPMLQNIYGDQESLTTLYQTFATNPAGIFLVGFMDSPTFGAFMTIETLLWWGLAIAFLNILLVVRHTRQNEEIGAQELIQSCRVGRSTGLVAVLLVALLTNTLITIVLGFGMTLLGGDYWGADQAWLYAINFGLFGLVWASITVIVVQLVDSARSAIGILAAIVGGAFMLRGIGDFMGTVGPNGLIQPAWFSLLSPFGWMQAARPLTFPEWGPTLIPIVFILIATPIAFLLMHGRDIGAGIFPSRKGRARASKFRKTPLGLTWYLQKNIFTGWFIGIMILVLTVGSLTAEMSRIFDTSDAVRKVIESIGGTGALIPAFLSAMLALATLGIIGYIVQGLGKLRNEEASGHVEHLLATKLSRTKWLALHITIVLAGGLIMLVASGSVLALCTNIATDYNVSVLEYALAGLSYFPILLAFTGAYLLIFGVVPRVVGTIIWAYYGFVAFATWIGPMLDFPAWAMSISIVHHFPSPPVDEIAVVPIIAFAIAAVAASALGITAWRNRDLATG